MIHEKEGLLLIHPFIHPKISVKEKSSIWNKFKIKENPQQSLKLIIDCRTVEKTLFSTAKLDVNKRCRSHSRVN